MMMPRSSVRVFAREMSTGRHFRYHSLVVHFGIACTRGLQLRVRDCARVWVYMRAWLVCACARVHEYAMVRPG